MISFLTLFLAIALAETNNQDTIVNWEKHAYGCVQIRQCVIDDVNNHYHLQYRLVEALDREVAKQIMVHYLMIYATEARLHHPPTYQDCARIWRGGPNGYRKNWTLLYWHRVQSRL